MKKFLISSILVASALIAHEHGDMQNFDPKTGKHLVITMEQLGEKGKGLASGAHGFHVHQNADCGATEKGLGMKAGGHWDPNDTKKHSFAWDDSGHKGDLPALFVDAEGNAVYPVLAPKIKSLDELKGHSLMVHVGGDNHSDHPKPLGGGGARMVCGVIK